MDQKTVLYADNDRDHLDVRSNLLERAGYHVIKAYSPAEAEAVLLQKNIHLAILDIRLADDSDERDISGIILAKDPRFKRIPKFFVTGYPTFEAVREAYGSVIGSEQIAHAVLSKGEGFPALLEAVNSSFEKLVGINWDLHVAWEEQCLLSFSQLALLVEPKLDLDHIASRSSELEDLFRKLFKTEEQILISRILWKRGDCACLGLFSLNKGVSRQAIVQVGPWEAIDQQRKHAGEFLARETGLLPAPVFAETLHYGGLVYTFPDFGTGLLEPVPEYFTDASEKDIRTSIDVLYSRSLHELHQGERSEIKKTDVAALYRDRLNIPVTTEFAADASRKVEALESAAQAYGLVNEIVHKDGSFQVTFTNGETFSAPDPLFILSNPGTFDKTSSVFSQTLGGITISSLLVDPDGRLLPADLSGIIRYPTLIDFVSLEAGFHFDLVGSYNLLSLLDFEKQLSMPDRLGEVSSTGVEPECRRSLAAVSAIRKAAAEEMGNSDLYPYLVGLFYYSIADLLQSEAGAFLPRHKVARSLHRLFTASLVLAQMDRLKDCAEGRSPARPGVGSLKISEAGREVSLDGRKISLTLTEFKLLSFLNKNPDRLCTREEILAEVFKFSGAVTDTEKGLLNTHIDRLRKKIDLNPSRHRYIVTIRGEGYKLDLKE